MQCFKSKETAYLDGKRKRTGKSFRNIDIYTINNLFLVIGTVFRRAQSHGRAKIDPASAEGSALHLENMDGAAFLQNIIAGLVSYLNHSSVSRRRNSALFAAISSG